MASTVSPLPDFDVFGSLPDLPAVSDIADTFATSIMSPSLQLDALPDLSAEDQASLFVLSSTAHSDPLKSPSELALSSGLVGSQSHPLVEAASCLTQLEQQMAAGLSPVDSDSNSKSRCSPFSIAVPQVASFPANASISSRLGARDLSSQSSHITPSAVSMPHNVALDVSSKVDDFDIDNTISPFSYNPHALTDRSPFSRDIQHSTYFSKSFDASASTQVPLLCGTDKANSTDIQHNPHVCAQLKATACQSVPTEDGHRHSGTVFRSSLPAHVACLPAKLPVKNQRSASSSAVEQCRKAAEEYANSKYMERKRKAGDMSPNHDDDDDDSAEHSNKKSRQNEGSPCSDDLDDNAQVDDLAENSDERPEDISHRKYLKRLEKNRKSAFVSRIRRREYTRILENKLAKVEEEAEQNASAYNKIRHEYDGVLAELNALRQTVQNRVADFGRAVMRPVGEVASNAAHHSASSTAVVTMFMFAIMFGMLLPDMRSSANYSGSAFAAASSEQHGSLTSTRSVLRETGDHVGIRDISRVTPLLLSADTCMTSGAFSSTQVSDVSSIKGELKQVKEEAIAAHERDEEMSDASDTRSIHGDKEEPSSGSSKRAEPSNFVELGLKDSCSRNELTKADEDVAFVDTELREIRVKTEVGDAADFIAQDCVDDRNRDVDSPHMDVGSPLSAITSCSAPSADDALAEGEHDVTMVDLDGQRVLDSASRFKTEHLDAIKRNATKLLGEQNADALASFIVSKVDHGSLSHESLAEIAAESRKAARLTSCEAKSSILPQIRSQCVENISTENGPVGVKEVQNTLTSSAESSVDGPGKGHERASENDFLTEDAAQGVAEKPRILNLAAMLNRIQHVADERLVPEIVALMTYNMMITENGVKRGC